MNKLKKLVVHFFEHPEHFSALFLVLVIRFIPGMLFVAASLYVLDRLGWLGDNQ